MHAKHVLHVRPRGLACLSCRRLGGGILTSLISETRDRHDRDIFPYNTLECQPGEITQVGLERREGAARAVPPEPHIGMT